MNFAGTIWFTALQQHVPQHALSRVSSYDWAGSVLFTPLGFILVGPLADQFGAADVLYAAAVWTVVSSVAILALPSVRNLAAGTRHRSRRAVDPLTADAGRWLRWLH